MERTCATHGCIEIIPPQQGRARPRKYCERCRPPRSQPNPRVIALPSNGADEASTDTRSALEASYRRELESCERLDTPEGAHVMLLAALFASGKHTSSGAASLSRELRAAMDEALKGAPRQADKMDELASRRAAKASSA